MKILLVDDHPLFREGVSLLLQRLEAGLEVLQAGNTSEALELTAAHADIDFVLLDLNMPGQAGLDALSVMRDRHPGMPVIVLSSADDESTVREAIDKGAMGFIPKSSSPDIMFSALRLVLAKGIYLPPTILLGRSSVRIRDVALSENRDSRHEGGTTAAQLGLTPRQVDVLRLILEGKPVKLICRSLDLSDSTVKGHISAVLRALNVTTRTQAIVAAHRLGLRFDKSDPSSDARDA